MKYVHSQYGVRTGELGDPYVGQQQYQQYHRGLRESINLKTEITGDTYRRQPFAWRGSIPQYAATLCNWVVIEHSWIDDNGAEKNYHIFLGHQKLVVYEYLFAQKRYSSPVVVKDTPYTETQIYNCDYVNLPDGYPTGVANLRGTTFFTSRSLHPFFLEVLNDGQNPQDYSFISAPIENLPYDLIGNAAYIRGTTIGTGECELIFQNAVWKLIATNECFGEGDDEWANQKVYIGNIAVARIVRRLNKKELQLALQKGGTVNVQHIQAGDVLFEQGYQPIAGDDIGWFDCCAFSSDGRLILGGTKKIPNAICASHQGRIMEFDLGTLQPDEGCYAKINFSTTEYMTSISATAQVEVTSNRATYVYKPGKEGFIPKEFINFVCVAPGVGADKLSPGVQLAQNGNVRIYKGLPYYLEFSEDTSSYKASGLFATTSKATFYQEGFHHNICVVADTAEEHDNKKASNVEVMYFINHNSEIIRVLLNFNEGSQPSYTRYRFNEHIKPVQLFTSHNRLFCIFLNAIDDNLYYTIITQLETDELYREYPGLDLETKLEFYEIQGDRAVLRIPHRSFGLSDCGDAEYVRELSGEITRAIHYVDGEWTLVEIPLDFYLQNRDKEMYFGLSYGVYMESMGRTGDPQLVPANMGLQRRICCVRFGNCCFSEFEIGVKEEDKTTLDARKNEAYFTKVNVGDTPGKPNSKRKIFQGTNGIFTSPVVVMKQETPGVFAFSGFETPIDLPGVQ